MNIQLKVSHIRLVAYHLKNIIAADVFNTLSELKAKTTKTDGPDDVKTVTIKAADFMFVFPLIAMSPEIESASMNRDIEQILRPQITAGIEAGDPEWAALGLFFERQQAEARARQQAKIEAGENFLHPE